MKTLHKSCSIKQQYPTSLNLSFWRGQLLMSFLCPYLSRCAPHFYNQLQLKHLSGRLLCLLSQMSPYLCKLKSKWWISSQTWSNLSYQGIRPSTWHPWSTCSTQTQLLYPCVWTFRSGLPISSLTSHQLKLGRWPLARRFQQLLPSMWMWSHTSHLLLRIPTLSWRISKFWQAVTFTSESLWKISSATQTFRPLQI